MVAQEDQHGEDVSVRDHLEDDRELPRQAHRRQAAEASPSLEVRASLVLLSE
jgi:hypothetical protein